MVIVLAELSSAYWNEKLIRNLILDTTVPTQALLRSYLTQITKIIFPPFTCQFEVGKKQGPPRKMKDMFPTSVSVTLPIQEVMLLK